MSRPIILIGAGVLLLVGILVATMTFQPSVPTQAAATATRDVNLQDALQRPAQLRSGERQVALNRDLSYQDLADLGFPMPAIWSQDQFQLIILKGDYDVTHLLAGGQGQPPAKYVLFIYDKAHPGLPVQMGGDNGSLVKKALGDPSLPDPVVPQQPIQQLHPTSPYEPPTKIIPQPFPLGG